jgi:hypothetical protein
MLHIRNLLLVPQSLVRHCRFLSLKFSDFLFQLCILLFQIRQVLLHVRTAFRELRLQTRNLSPDLLDFAAPLGHRCPQTCAI